MELIKLSEILTGQLPYQNINDDCNVLIGRALWGPSMIPIEATSIDQVTRVFGADSELGQSYIEASQLGMRNIYLIKINGEPSHLDITGNGVPKLRLTTVEANDLTKFYKHGVEVRGEEKFLIIYYNRKSRPSQLIAEYSLNGITIEDLVEKINRDAYATRIPMYASILNNSNDEIASVIDMRSDWFVGGMRHSFFGNDLLYDRLSTVLNYLLPANIKQLGVIYSNFNALAKQRGFIYGLISQFTKDKEELGLPCIVNVGLDVNHSKDALDNTFDWLLKHGKPYSTIQSDGLILDKHPMYSFSEYINVILAKFKVRTNTPFSNHISNGVASYTALIDTLQLDSSTTNKKISHIEEDLFQLSDVEVKHYTDLGCTVLAGDSPTNMRIYKGVNMLYYTGGECYSSYYDEENQEHVITMKRYPKLAMYTSNILLIREIKKSLSIKLDSLNNDSITKAKIESIILTVLRGFEDILRDYNFIVNEIINRTSKDYEVDISITPYGELNSIDFTLSI